MDDTWLEASVFVDNLEALLVDKLYGHDQKKMIQKVDMGKEPEMKLTQIRNELREFYYQFANSLKNMFGYVSYKRLQEYIDRT